MLTQLLVTDRGGGGLLDMISKNKSGLNVVHYPPWIARESHAALWLSESSNIEWNPVT